LRGSLALRAFGQQGKFGVNGGVTFVRFAHSFEQQFGFGVIDDLIALGVLAE
jgi:hypothetical protein